MSMADTLPVSRSAVTGEVTLRRASPGDAEALARGVVEGVADYPAFAPPGWTGPTYEEELAHHRDDLRQEHFHCIVAEIDGAIVGQITVVPAARAGNPVDDPALGHVRNLFVDRAQWGSGLAGRLHEAALAPPASGASRSCGCSWPPARPARGRSTSARAGARPGIRSTIRFPGC